MSSTIEPSDRSCIVILLAGGNGSRYNQRLPKQFSPLKGHPILFYTLDTFNACSQVDEILLVVPAATPDAMIADTDKVRWDKLKKPLIQGGRRRCDSCYNALKVLRDYPSHSIVLVHDVVRPLASTSLITRSIAALGNNIAVSASLPLTDTLAETQGEEILNIVPRDKYHQLQTPQGFSFPLLMAAYDFFYTRDEGTEREPTDDCSIVRAYDESVPIKLVQGETANMKLTYPTDLRLLESFLELKG